MIRGRVPASVLAVACALAVTGCDDDAGTAPGPGPGPEGTAPVTQGTSPGPVPDPGGEASLQGVAIVRQDVEGLPDLPLWDGAVLVLTPAEAEALWAGVEGDPPTAPGDSGVVLPDNVVAPDGAVATGTTLEVDDDGRFAADLPAGDYLLCLLAFPPTRVAGCGEVTVPVRVTVLTGQVPFILQVEDA